MSNKYINLKINGRLFPSWILLNFKKYKLPKVLMTDGDPCKIQVKDLKQKLRRYQEFVSKYLDYKSLHKEILLYHGLGSGKTATTINLMNILYNYTPSWNVFIIIKASIRNNWMNEINKWLPKDEFNERFKNIRFINYDSPFADKNFIDAKNESDSSKKPIYIFDEVHNFINNVYNNIVSKTGKRAFVIYNQIQQEKREDKDTRIVLMTGTPAINNPYEIALIFNLLRPGIFPDNEVRFIEMYIKDNKLNSEKVNMFQRRIMGLVSYYSGDDKSLFAEKRYNKIVSNMHSYQQEVYDHFEAIEDKIEKSKPKSSSKSNKIPSTYKSFTRQSCNFTFPVIDSKINGEKRPRPSNFKVNENEVQNLMEGKEIETKDKNYIQYLDMANLFMKKLDLYFKNIQVNDSKLKKSILDDVEIFKKKYNYNYDRFWKEHKNKSNLLKEFHKCSSKITAMIFNSFSSKGPLVMYSNYVKMEGLEVIKIYLKYFGFIQFEPNKSKDHYTYTEFHGSISMEERARNNKFFNTKENIYGKVIKIILISPAGSEGISLMNVRQVHVLEPYWNEVRIEQLIGRAIRQCSHSALPMNERYVDIYRYISARKNNKETTDENIQNLANKKKKLIDSFLIPLKEIAVDCELFKNHNIKNNEYKCFKFTQDTQFDKNIGPAFKMNEENDINFNNGLNFSNTISKEIEVVQIKAVKRIDKDNFSDEQNFNFDKDTGIVYDIDLDFPIGRIYFDEDGIPEMLDKNTLIISEIIPIPMLSNES